MVTVVFRASQDLHVTVGINFPMKTANMYLEQSFKAKNMIEAYILNKKKRKVYKI